MNVNFIIKSTKKKNKTFLRKICKNIIILYIEHSKLFPFFFFLNFIETTFIKNLNMQMNSVNKCYMHILFQNYIHIHFYIYSYAYNNIYDI